MLRRFRHWLFRTAVQQPSQPLATHEEGAASAAADRELALELELSRRLAAESELQKLRFDLEAAHQRLVQLQADLQRQGHDQAASLEDQLDAQLETVLTPLITPLAQLLTQQHLIEQQGKELSARDLLATSRRIWQGLTPAGLAACETIGAVVAFDPDRHQPLSQTTVLGRGDTVRVKIPGILLKGRLLKPAAVEPIKPNEPSGAAATR
ncbi:nucleotide exchange factor GrpE [Synechococcus sp. CS-1325]|uniref:nucleotide exchange factor GrpE n=1 Tax=Synechococcus sp. CS-1325 TaxID=2847979 RepID=UPI00223BEBA3|nr:nucleotide exchange factor GrpE [Synechococcus sp. CS-1325]MCT0198262.1 nucleotide exchange factor GrpE [Synechococcus sp. CS-1325]